MGIAPAIFKSAGQLSEHLIPGVYDRSNNVTSPNGISEGNLCILGKSIGGKPLTLLNFSSITDAKETLVGGELLEAIGHAFNCSPDYTPRSVYAMRVNTGTQSTRSLYANNGDTSTEVLKLYSWDYGVHTNQLKMKLKNISNKFEISVVYKGSEIKKSNIGRNSISITASKPNSQITINQTGVTLVVNSVAQEGESQTVLLNETISFDEAPYLTDLVDKINSYTDSTGDFYFYASLKDLRLNINASELDYTSVSLTENTATTFNSDIQALKEALSTIQYVGDVEIVNRILPSEDSSYVYFAGGTEGDYTPTEWSEALNVLALENIQIITTPSTDIAILGMIATHCIEMSSTINKKERTCILGGELNESIEQATQRAGSNFVSELVSYVCDSIIAINPITGIPETLPASYLACKLAGLESALGVGTPLTNKKISIVGFTKKRTNKEYEKLISAGVLPCGANELGDFIVIRAMTTFQGEDLMKCERSMVRENLFMNRDLRQVFFPVIGTNDFISPSMATDILLAKAKDWANKGYIVPDDKGNNVFDIKVKVDGDKTYITYSRYLSAPRNFIFVTVNNYTYSTETVEL